MTKKFTVNFFKKKKSKMNDIQSDVLNMIKYRKYKGFQPV